MKNIKLVIRRDLPETNSSSSHSVVISSDILGQVGPGSPYWDLPMDAEGYIHIPSCSFGREWDKFNTVLRKVQYVCGLMNNALPGLKELADIICSVSGAKGVIFDWLPEFYERIQEIGDDFAELKYWRVPEGCDVDHQSMDLDQEILESPQTLKNFIFNSSSVLFLGSDETESANNFYSPSTEPDAIVSVELGGLVGRVDFPIPTYPCNLKESLRTYNSFLTYTGEVFDSIVYHDGQFKPKYMVHEDVTSYFSYHGPQEDGKLLWAKDELYSSSMFFSAKGKNVLEEHPDMWIAVPYQLTIREFGKVL